MEHCAEKAITHQLRPVSVDDLNRKEFDTDISSFIDLTQPDIADQFKTEQKNDQSLQSTWNKTTEENSDYIVDLNNQLLYKMQDTRNGISKLLVLPTDRRELVMKVAHSSSWGLHLVVEKTQKRIQIAFTWPSIGKDVQDYVKTCQECQVGQRKPRRTSFP